MRGGLGSAENAGKKLLAAHSAGRAAVDSEQGEVAEAGQSVVHRANTIANWVALRIDLRKRAQGAKAKGRVGGGAHQIYEPTLQV